MGLLGVVATVILVLAVLLISHAVAWYRGFLSGKHVAVLDSQIERLKEIKK